MRNLSNWFFAKYPKQQLHELNLDWIIDTVVTIDTTLETFREWAEQTFLKPDDMSNKTFNELNTTSKSIIGAVNEVNTKSLKKDIKYIDFGGSEHYTIVEGINQVHGMATSPKMMVGNYGTTPFDVLYDAYHTNHLPTYIHKTTYEDGFTNDRYFHFYDYSEYTGLDKVMSFIEVKGVATGAEGYSLGATVVTVTKSPEGQTSYDMHDINIEPDLVFFKCEYNGGNITHNNIIQNYEALVSAYENPNLFLFVEAYGLTMIPCFFPTEGDPVLEFTSAWIEDKQASISRLIINSSNQIKYEDIALEKERVILTYDGTNLKKDNVILTNSMLADILDQTNNVVVYLNNLDYYLPMVEHGTQGDYILFCALIDNIQYRISYEDGEVSFNQQDVAMMTDAVAYTKTQNPSDFQLYTARSNLKMFILTEVEYESLTNKDPNALYFVKETPVTARTVNRVNNIEMSDSAYNNISIDEVI